MDKLERLKSTISQRAAKRWGIGLKGSYLQDLSACFEGGYCPAKLFRNAPSGATIEQLVKDSANQFTYTNERMRVRGLRRAESGSDEILRFDAIITSKKKDRDGDILHPDGAEVDKHAPLLWQHIPWEPIGKLLEVTKQNSQRIAGSFVIFNTEMGRDAAMLVRNEALRISHGFIPTEYEPRETKDGDFDGWTILKYEMMEVSLVSVPSNTDAVITAFSDGKLFSPAVKSWAKGLYDGRQRMVPVGIDLKSLPAGTQIIIGGAVQNADVRTSEGCDCHKGSETFTKGAVPYAATTPADKGRAWDAGEAKKRLKAWAGDDMAKYRRGFAYVAGDGKNEGDYKLPHHDIVDGKLAVVWNGVKAAMGAAHGARSGGMDLGGDEGAVVAHLKKHYAQFDETYDDEGKGMDDLNTKRKRLGEEKHKDMECAYALSHAAHTHDDTGTVPKALMGEAKAHVKALLDWSAEGNVNDAGGDAGGSESGKAFDIKAMSAEMTEHAKAGYTCMKAAHDHDDTGIAPKALIKGAMTHMKGILPIEHPEGQGDDPNKRAFDIGAAKSEELYAEVAERIARLDVRSDAYKAVETQVLKVKKLSELTELNSALAALGS